MQRYRALRSLIDAIRSDNMGPRVCCKPSASALIEKIFDVGAHSEIRAAAAAWASDSPEEIRTSSEALFNFDMLETGGAGPSRSKLKKTILELHNIPQRINGLAPSLNHGSQRETTSDLMQMLFFSSINLQLRNTCES